MKIILLSLFLLLSCNTAEDPSSTTGPPNLSPIYGDEVTEELLQLVNNHRQNKGLRALVLDPYMNDIALGHSLDMASSKVGFGHSGFSTRCEEARHALGGGNLCLENVARGQKTAGQVFNSWINSTGHRENIESARASHMGLGYTKDKSGSFYWTQLFLER